MEPVLDGRGGKENQQAPRGAGEQSSGCLTSPSASPASPANGSGARKRPQALAGHPEHSPLVDPARKRHRPGRAVSASVSPAGERETSAEAAARRELAALSSPSGRRAGGAAQEQSLSSSTAQQAPASSAAPPPPPPPPPTHWWIDRPLQSLKRATPDAGQDAFALLPGHPLLALACEGQAALLAKVLANGGEVDAQDSRGLTALHLASRHARLACVKVLLEAGAQQLCDRLEGSTPLDLAKQAGHDDVLEMVHQQEEVQAELQRQARELQQLAEAGGAAGDEGTGG